MENLAGINPIKVFEDIGIPQLAGFLGLMLFPETRNFNMVKLNSTIGLAFLVSRFTPFHGEKADQKKPYDMFSHCMVSFRQLFITRNLLFTNIF
ncbi:MAG: hypothetical protein R3B93_12195 [Bacteroidia bacterium]